MSQQAHLQVGDNLDFRVMLAREIYREDCWRLHGYNGPILSEMAHIDTVAVETNTNTTVRDQVEDFCGGPLLSA